MRPADIWRHTSVRLALGVVALIVTTLMLAGGIAYGLIRSELAARQDARVSEIFAALQETGAQGDLVDLIDSVTARILASPDGGSLYRLTDAAGAVLAANLAVRPAPGWSDLPAEALGPDQEVPYRLFRARIGDYDLSVGLSDLDLNEVQEIAVAAFGWTALVSIAATLLVAGLLALRVQRRLATAEATMRRVAQGDLTARLPIGAGGDDLDRLSQAINGALARLAAVVESMRQVSVDIAHDLRTPLNRLRIHVETALEKTDAAAPVADELSAALAQAQAIDRTFAALLRIAQIEAGARVSRFAPLDLSALMREVAEVYTDVAADCGQRLTCTADVPGRVTGDPELLTQLLANLIENAIRHCPPGSVIACEVRALAGRLVASVRDSGPGIPVAEREMVLRRLYRLEQSRTTEGSGLGLSLVKAVADLHHADLTLTDAAPGLCVSVVFPTLCNEFRE